MASKDLWYKLERLVEILPQVSVNFEITPSDGALSKNKKSALSVFAALKLAEKPTLLVKDDSDYLKELDTIPFEFRWKKKQDEKEGYPPLIQHLGQHGFKLTDVSSGSRLVDNELFDVFVWSLRHLDGVPGQKPEVQYRCRIHGRTDLLSWSAGGQDSSGDIMDWMADYAIEVKKTLAGRVDLSEREALLQLIGLNVANQHKAPPVVLTDLVSTHFVYSLRKIRGELLQFVLTKRQFRSVLSAVHFARRLAQDPRRVGLAADFGRGPTAVPSPASSIGPLYDSGSQDLDGMTDVSHFAPLAHHVPTSHPFGPVQQGSKKRKRKRRKKPAHVFTAQPGNPFFCCCCC